MEDEKVLRRDAQTGARAAQPRPKHLKKWHRMLVPAFDRPFSNRCLELAYCLAQDCGAVVELSYVIEVPRMLDLEAMLPEQELVAQQALQIAQHAAVPYKVRVEPYVHRTRNATEGILRLAAQEQIDVLVLGGRPDGNRGLPSEVARDLFQRATCEVIVDYIAGEK